MSTFSQPIGSDLEKSLSEKPDRDLVSILENPDDWKPEVVDFARLELGRRSVSLTQIDRTLAEKDKQKDEELQRRSIVPLTFWESFFAVLDGALLGLFGLLFIWPQASRFRANGYMLKSKKSWKLYWVAFGVRVTVVIISLVIIVSISH